ncbi:MAG: signal peptidase II [Betaproteobacteria bacterium]
MRPLANALGATRAGATGGRAPLHWLWLSVAVIIADQLTKRAIVDAFRPGDELPLTPFVSLVLAFNRGAAFSFLAGEAGWQRWLFTLIAIAACAVMTWLLRKGGSTWLCMGLALIIGGALGNLYDRLVLGHVVDFLLVHWRGWYFPAFNVADSAITVGAASLILDSFRPRPAVAVGAE